MTRPLSGLGPRTTSLLPPCTLGRPFVLQGWVWNERLVREWLGIAKGWFSILFKRGGGLPRSSGALVDLWESPTEEILGDLCQHTSCVSTQHTSCVRLKDGQHGRIIACLAPVACRRCRIPLYVHTIQMPDKSAHTYSDLCHASCCAL